MKFFTALTSALAITTAIAAPFAGGTAETNSLEERTTPLQNTGITVFHSRDQATNGRFRSRFRLMGFLQATGPMLDVLKEKMDVSSSTDQPVERASVIAQAFFGHLRSWLSQEFPFRVFRSTRALFNAGAAGNAAWEGTIGAQFEIGQFSDADYNKMIDALKAYLTPRGSDAVEVVFTSVADAFAIGNPTEYDLPQRKTRSANVCSSTTSIINLFQSRVPEIPSYLGQEC